MSVQTILPIYEAVVYAAVFDSGVHQHRVQPYGPQIYAHRPDASGGSDFKCGIHHDTMHTARLSHNVAMTRTKRSEQLRGKKP